ncbi:site-specific integrase [Terasakiella sp. A23]|uniref:tyrosine-type recombinase/integrase n=1 Tax=Terasakiella sp. FCG-A23 TaxID=3080561 RepID=UPI0029539368|nr:site-specific integrase [Terasakiella sp. A23]MDV7341843.1 site-specific integrase [Terasakiella sp. A23]
MSKEGKAKVLTDAEFERLLKITAVEAHAARNTAILICLFGLGLRVHECSSLRLCDVMDGDREIRQQFQIRIANSKTNRNREVFLSNLRVRRAIKSYINHRRATEGPDLHPNAFLFRSQKGSRFTGNTMQQLVKRLFIKSGLPDTTSSHSGRRTFATRLINRGVGLKNLSSLMGHATVNQSTEYADTNPVILERIVKGVV